MSDRGTSAITGLTGRVAEIAQRGLARLGFSRPPIRPVTPPSETDRIVFSSTDAGDASFQDLSADKSCVCPVTRQVLKAGDRIYQCRACNMAYSEAGWEFLNSVDRGRCCGCRNRKTVFPVR